MTEQGTHVVDRASGQDEAAPGLHLSQAALRHLCVNLIVAEQDRLRRTSGFDAQKANVLRRPGLTPTAIDAILVDDDTLGFDSLSILELILTLNRFFGLHRTGIEDYLLVKRRLGDWIALLTEHFVRAPADLDLTFLTSGSSGTPKEIAHPLARLQTEVRATRQGPLAMLRPNGRVLALVPPQHIYGFLFTALLPSIADLRIVDLNRAGPGAALRLARPGDLIVATPLNWQLLNQGSGTFEANIHGVVSAGPTVAATWDIVNNKGLASLTEIYGSTETAGLATRTVYDAPFTLMSHLRRTNDGVADARGPLPVQDRLTWCGARTFVLAGRLDDAVQVAGVNVSLTEVRAQILAHDGVEDAAVRLHDTRLKAFVQTSLSQDRYDALDRSIRLALDRNLAAVARPQSIRFGSTLPRNAMGKLCDWHIENPVSTTT